MLTFNDKGLLPPNDYPMTLEDIKNSILVKGNGEINWDVDWRHYLVDQLSILVKQLWQVGISEIFIDGSFVEKKPPK